MRCNRLILHTIVDMNEVFHDNSIGKSKNHNTKYAYSRVKNNNINRLISTNPHDYLALSNYKGRFGTKKGEIQWQ